MPDLDLALMTTILYAARSARRVPESDAEKHRAIAESYADAMLITAAVLADMATPEQPPPSPGNQTGVLAEATAGRRRTANGRWTATGS